MNCESNEFCSSIDDLQPLLVAELPRPASLRRRASAANRIVVAAAELAWRCFSGSTSIDQSRSVDAFHCDVFAFS